MSTFCPCFACSVLDPSTSSSHAKPATSNRLRTGSAAATGFALAFIPVEAVAAAEAIGFRGLYVAARAGWSLSCFPRPGEDLIADPAVSSFAVGCFSETFWLLRAIDASAPVSAARLTLRTMRVFARTARIHICSAKERPNSLLRRAKSQDTHGVAASFPTDPTAWAGETTVQVFSGSPGFMILLASSTGREPLIREISSPTATFPT
mmetsp:Transcript_43997/g.104116  ORF Transcript_43997/g.104116 Transcript_43997/m.104116 type:complete len:207 (-) Transcript_43997:726-1346(-)